MKKYYFLIIVALILGLALTGCSLLSNISQVPTSEQSGISYLTKGTETPPFFFSDNFESYGLGPLGLLGFGDWQHVSGTPSIVLDTVGGFGTQVLGIVGGSYVGEAVAVAGSPDWQDYILDLDAKKCSGNYFNIVFRYVNSGTYYMVESPSASTHIALWKKVGGIFTELAPRPLQPTVTGDWYHYRIELRTTLVGTNIKVFIDGVEKFDVTDDTPTLARGSVGVGGYGSESRFDNVVVMYEYGFLGLLPPYAAPPRAFKRGSSIPLKWKYADLAGIVVDSSLAIPRVRIIPTGGIPPEVTDDAIEVQAPGESGLRYDSNTDMWIFNWQTKEYLQPSYQVYITSFQTGQTNGPFEILLK